MQKKERKYVFYQLTISETTFAHTIEIERIRISSPVEASRIRSHVLKVTNVNLDPFQDGIERIDNTTFCSS